MNRKITILIALLFIAISLHAQFDPSAVKNSLVRVVVAINEKESNVLTGFVWKTPTQIVTSLHGMSATGTIKVLYLNQAWRKAKIKKVLQKADLVLLEILPGEAPVPPGVVPLTTYNSQNVKFGTEIYAMGYNSGSQGSSSRTLKKGFVDPETLDNLIPKKDRAALARIGFPALDLHILYLEGSLLPGYSGSPVFDPAGKLIGIGDGGLEDGASNVSWIIPAKYLAELESSTTTTLPANFDQIAQLFSARSVVESPVNDVELLEENLVSAAYNPLKTNDFEFYLTKNRSIVEMVESSDNSENLLKFATEFEEYNLQMDYDKMRFDIYEDINNGVILAVPEGRNLFYDDENGYFGVNYTDDDLVSLFYVGVKDDYSATDFEDVLVSVQDWANTSVAEIFGISNFTVDHDYSYWLDVDGNRKIAWISMMGDETVSDEYGNINAVGLYIAVLMSQEKSFMAVSSYFVPVDLLLYASTYGLDCVNPVYPEQCAYFDSLFKVFAASHLTTFAY